MKLCRSDLDTATDVQVRVLALDPSHPPGPQSMVVTLCGPTDSRRCDTGPSFSLGQQVPGQRFLILIRSGGLFRGRVTRE